MNEKVKKEFDKIVKELKLSANTSDFTNYDWSCISRFQDLSGEFIMEFKNKVDWFEISRYQILSDSFIILNRDKLDLGYLIANDRVTEEFEKRLFRRVKSRTELLDFG